MSNELDVAVFIIGNIFPHFIISTLFYLLAF